jgi:hypothetical protein
MIKLKTATKPIGDIPKGEPYVCFTSKDADNIQKVADKRGISFELAAQSAIDMWLRERVSALIIKSQ